MRARRAKTSCDTSLMILALSLGDNVVNHFARRCECRVLLVCCVVCRPRTLSTASERSTYDFALPRQQDEISRGSCQPGALSRGRGRCTYRMAMISSTWQRGTWRRREMAKDEKSAPPGSGLSAGEGICRRGTTSVDDVPLTIARPSFWPLFSFVSAAGRTVFGRAVLRWSSPNTHPAKRQSPRRVRKLPPPARSLARPPARPP